MRLSDALRGAAESAPVDEVQVSAGRTAARVTRDRALRGSANAMVGAGAVAVLVVGAAAGQPPGLTGDGMTLAVEDAAPEMGEMDVFTDGAAGTSRAAGLALCGLPSDDVTWGDALVTLDAGAVLDGDVPPASDVELDVTATALEDVHLLTNGPEWVVLWEDIVVGTADANSAILYGPADEPSLNLAVMQDVELAEGESWSTTVSVPLVNCWDGNALPSGEYRIETRQDFFGADAPATDLDDSVTDGAGDLSAEPPAEPSDGPEVAEAAPEAAAAAAMPDVSFRVAAPVLSVTVAGEVPEDPFGDYLNRPEPLPEPLPEPYPSDIAVPDGLLTPDIARELFEAGRTNGTWDMAAGTQRWLKVTDFSQDSTDQDWSRNHFGCSWDGGSAPTFPAESAEMRLMEAQVGIPSRLSLSHGWVVDGNPTVPASVTNVSEYALPGFWENAPQLYLVRDGRVVAEAMLHDVDRGYYGPVGRAAGLTMTPSGAQALEPGASIGNDYLWREVNGCMGATSFDDVPAGTYTVLAVHHLHVTSYGSHGGAAESNANARILPAPESGLGGGVSGDLGSDSSTTDFSIAIEPDVAWDVDPAQMMDIVDLQSWTSLGTITISH